MVTIETPTQVSTTTRVTSVPLVALMTHTATAQPVKAPSYKILVICPFIYSIPLSGYGGTEAVAFNLITELHRRGHQVSVIACEGSKLPDGVELIPMPLRCSEEYAYNQYKGRLVEFMDGGILDMTFGYWSIQSNIGVEPQLPIIKTHHTDPSVWQSGPLTQWPCLVGLSLDHSRRLSLAYGCTVECAYNGVDLEFYHYDPNLKRNGRLLHIGRFTNEKGVLQSMQLAKRLKMPLDCYGDVEIVSSQEYVDRCRREADGIMVRFFPGVSREKTVELYNTYRAFLFTPTWQEPFGYCIVESQACGLPVVTLNTGSLPEVVNHGVSGFTCQDSDEVARVLTSGDLGKIKPEDCVAWAQKFSREKMTDRYLELIERVRQGHRW